MDSYARIERAIRYLEAHFRDQPALRDAAREARLSEFHFQRVFTEWAGVSPKRFLMYLTSRYAKERLRESRSVLDATLDTGLSGPGRLHDLLLSVEAMTPGEYKAQGKGLEIGFGFHPTPFGECLLARTARGICGFTFLAGRAREDALDELRAEWPRARFGRDPRGTGVFARGLFEPGARGNGARAARLVLKGTPFQLKVWEALLSVPPGYLVSYRDVARRIGSPSACRAVGTAIARNPIGYLIPCHRVIRETGVIGDYRWGPERKKLMIGWEAARSG